MDSASPSKLKSSRKFGGVKRKQKHPAALALELSNQKLRKTGGVSDPVSSPAPGTFQKKTQHSLTSNPNDGSLSAFFAAQISGLLTAMGLNSAQMKAVLMQIDYSVTPAQHQALNNNVLLSKSSLMILSATAKSIETRVRENADIQAAVKIQQIARGFLVRKPLSKFDKEARGRMARRNDLYRRMMADEDDFFQKMERVQDVYDKPLKENPIKGVSPNCLAYLFMNIQALLVLHGMLVKVLRKLPESKSFPFFSGIGETFLKYSGNMLSVYTRYCDMYSIAQHVLNEACQVPKFVAFLDERASEGKTGQETLKALLEAPIAHFNSYDSKLTMMLGVSVESDPGYMALVRASTLIGAATDLNRGRIDSGKRRTFQQTLNVEKRIEVDDPLLLLGWSKRKFLKEGPAKSVSDTPIKKPYLYMFNDLCIICEVLGGGLTKFHSIVDLSTVDLEPEAAKSKSAIELVLPDTRRTLTFKSSEKSEWYNTFKEVVEVYSKNRVYGVPLDVALEHEGRSDSIPLVVERGIEFLAEAGLDTEGIFRISGDRQQIIQMKKGFDTGNGANVDFRECTIHDVAGVVKLFLRELPEPLIPFSLYSTLIEMYEDYEMHEDKRKYLDGMAEAFQKTPESNKRLLSRLLPFLRQLATHAAVTKMTVANLSTVLTPNLIRPEIDTVTTAMQSGKVNLIGESLIRYSDFLVDGDTTAIDQELGASSGASAATEDAGEGGKSPRKKKRDKALNRSSSKSSKSPRLSTKLPKSPRSKKRSGSGGSTIRKSRRSTTTAEVAASLAETEAKKAAEAEEKAAQDEEAKAAAEATKAALAAAEKAAADKAAAEAKVKAERAEKEAAEKEEQDGSSAGSDSESEEVLVADADGSGEDDDDDDEDDDDYDESGEEAEANDTAEPSPLIRKRKRSKVRQDKHRARKLTDSDMEHIGEMDN